MKTAQLIYDTIPEQRKEPSPETGSNLRSLNFEATSPNQRGIETRRGSDFISIPTNKLSLEGGQP